MESSGNMVEEAVMTENFPQGITQIISIMYNIYHVYHVDLLSLKDSHGKLNIDVLHFNKKNVHTFCCNILCGR